MLSWAVHACAQAASEDELRVSLGLVNYTTGKGKAALNETNMRPIEVFMCSVVRPPEPTCRRCTALPAGMWPQHRD